MTPKQIALVQESFQKIAPMAGQAAKLFYDRLFATMTHLRPMFKNDMDAQGRKLMATLGSVVSNLHQPDAVLPTARDLAIRHAGYGVRPEHYEPVGEALLWTVEQGLGADFTGETAEAWRTAYSALSADMIAAAYPLRAAV